MLKSLSEFPSVENEVSFPGTTSASLGDFPKAPCYLGLSRHNFMTQIQNHGTFNQLQWSHRERKSQKKLRLFCEMQFKLLQDKFSALPALSMDSIHDIDMFKCSPISVLCGTY